MNIEDRAKELELVTCEIRRGVNRFEPPYRYTDWDKLARHVEGLVLEARIDEQENNIIFSDLRAMKRRYGTNPQELIDRCNSFRNRRIADLDAELEKVRAK